MREGKACKWGGCNGTYDQFGRCTHCKGASHYPKPHELVNNGNGLCARMACKAPLPEPRYKHKHSGFFYCRRCADLINRACEEELVCLSS